MSEGAAAMLRAVIAIVNLLLLAGPLLAGQYNHALSVGDRAPEWSNLPGVDGKEHSFADFKDKNILVVVFTCCSCPIATDYEDRIIAFTKKYAGSGDKVALVAINVNTIPDDRLPQMQARAREKGFPFPYLYDATQKIAQDYGAYNTPQFFVLNRDRKIVYMGAMDDRDDPAQAKVNYVEDAVKASLAGEKPQVTETFARGCAVRWQRKRPKR
jgi:peroxiredoxin